MTAITIAFGAVARSNQGELGVLAFRLYDEAFMSMSYLRSAQNTVLSVSRDLVEPSLAKQSVINDKLDSALSDLTVAQSRALSPEGRAAASWLQQQVSILRDQVAADPLANHPRLTELEDRFDSAVEINAGDGFRSRRKASELVEMVERQTWLITGISAAVALLITFLLSRAIVPSVRHAVGIATNIAAGRLDNPIPTSGSGETAVLLRALATMQQSIAENIARIEQLMAQQASSYATEIAVQHLRFETALDNMMQGLCMLDDNRRIIVHNRRFTEMFSAIPPGELLAQNLPPPLVLADLTGTERQPRAYTRTLEDQRTIAASERPMDTGGWVVTYEDVSERHRSEARLAHSARHDPLTGLPNRLRFREQMDQELADNRRLNGLAVLCFDLDHFKVINDTLGHAVGDMLLCEIAGRLTSHVSEGDTVVRLDGDEFGIIQCAANQPNDAKALAEQLSSAMAIPFNIDGQSIVVGISIGIAVYGAASADTEALMKNADLALYRAKVDGRGMYCFFEAEMDALVQTRRRLEIDLRIATEQDQFEVYYQPLVATASRMISGFEALVRWRHPTRGMVSPAEFIPVAEETGLIARLGAIVLEHACRDAACWPSDVKIAVNLSPIQFRNRNLAADVAAVLDRTGLTPSRLELEVTESVMLQDDDSIMVILHEIRGLGVRISMDDFGTGYSSLSSLRRFPFDKIKIDQSFIRNLDESNDCLAIVRAVLGLGRSLGMRVVAEGVETEEQYTLLYREGCEQLQGYLFSKPQPIGAVRRLIETFNSVPALHNAQPALAPTPPLEAPLVIG